MYQIKNSGEVGNRLRAQAFYREDSRLCRNAANKCALFGWASALPPFHAVLSSLGLKRAFFGKC
jgi:hypothetical protein